MSTALATKGIIVPDANKTFCLRGIENTAICHSARGYITAVGFADVIISYDFEESISFDDVTITVYPNGQEQRIGGISNVGRRFKLNFPILSSDKVEELWDFYISRHGPLYPFLFTSPKDNTQYLARFADKTMSRTLFAYLLESTGLNLIELIGE